MERRVAGEGRKKADGLMTVKERRGGANMDGCRWGSVGEGKREGIRESAALRVMLIASKKGERVKLKCSLGLKLSCYNVRQVFCNVHFRARISLGCLVKARGILSRVFFPPSPT